MPVIAPDATFDEIIAPSAMLAVLTAPLARYAVGARRWSGGRSCEPFTPSLNQMRRRTSGFVKTLAGMAVMLAPSEVSPSRTE